MLTEEEHRYLLHTIGKMGVKSEKQDQHISLRRPDYWTYKRTQEEKLHGSELCKFYNPSFELSTYSSWFKQAPVHPTITHRHTLFSQTHTLLFSTHPHGKTIKEQQHKCIQYNNWDALIITCDEHYIFLSFYCDWMSDTVSQEWGREIYWFDPLSETVQLSWPGQRARATIHMLIFPPWPLLNQTSGTAVM